MIYTNPPNTNYIGRFKVGDIVIAGNSSSWKGERGIILEEYPLKAYLIKWENRAVPSNWSDVGNWIIPNLPPLLTRDSLVDNYEI